MLKHLFRMLPVFSALLWLWGCSTTLNVAEVLQQPKGKKIYTRCNLWYDGARQINAMNYQNGKILPYGTPVDIREVSSTKVVFVANGAEYRIIFRPEWLVISMRDYLKQVFTLSTREELSKGIEPRLLDEIERGRVVKGMSRDLVLLCCGHPAACRTTSLNNDTWIFWTDPGVTIRVVFKNNKVVDVLSL